MNVYNSGIDVVESIDGDVSHPGQTADASSKRGRMYKGVYSKCKARLAGVSDGPDSHNHLD